MPTPLSIIQAALSQHKPAPFPYGKFPYEAAVLALITREASPRLLLTQRSSKLETHSGQVAFPGGIYEEKDGDLQETALRETSEEVGICPEEIEIIGELSPVFSHHKIAVKPYVGFVTPDAKLCKNPAEVAAIFAPTLKFFLNSSPCPIHPAPCFHYEHYRIWGLTGIMISELLSLLTK